MYTYDQFFAGTYFYVRKVERLGENEGAYYAIKASILLGFSEFMLLWGVTFIGFEGPYLSNLPLIFGVIAALMLANYLVFCSRNRYLKLIERYRKDSRRLTWIAVTIHLAFVGTLAVPFAVRVMRM